MEWQAVVDADSPKVPVSALVTLLRPHQGGGVGGAGGGPHQNVEEAGVCTVHVVPEGEAHRGGGLQRGTLQPGTVPRSARGWRLNEGVMTCKHRPKVEVPAPHLTKDGP